MVGCLEQCGQLGWLKAWQWLDHTRHPVAWPRDPENMGEKLCYISTQSILNSSPRRPVAWPHPSSRGLTTGSRKHEPKRPSYKSIHLGLIFSINSNFHFLFPFLQTLFSLAGALRILVTLIDNDALSHDIHSYQALWTKHFTWINDWILDPAVKPRDDGCGYAPGWRVRSSRGMTGTGFKEWSYSLITIL